MKRKPVPRSGFLLQLALATGMVFSVQLLQALTRNVSVDLCSGDVSVPQKHLYHTEISPVVQ